jgi:Fe-S cluster assembly protein SufD
VSTAVETGPFAHLGEPLTDRQLPGTDAEEWRYSRVERIDPGSFRVRGDVPVDEAASAAAESVAAEVVASIGSVSGLAVLVDGVVVRVELDEAAGATGVQVLGRPVDVAAAVADSVDVFGEVNAVVADVAVRVDVPRGARLDDPFVVIHLVTLDGLVVAPRLEVELGEDAQATVVELHRSLGEIDSLVVPVARFSVGRDSTVRHVLVQDLSTAEDVVVEVAADVGQSGTYDGWAAALGGRYARLRVDCRLAGRGAAGTLAAVYAGLGDQMHDLRTFQDHLDRDTRSSLEFKGTVDDRAHAVYTGLIRIHPEGRGSNAEQSNRIMTLSDEAWAESVPNLEIEHNDVRCAHASTVGPVDADQRFYLESRGVPTEVAERLIVSGFADEILERCPVPGVAALVRPRLSTILGGVDR